MNIKLFLRYYIFSLSLNNANKPTRNARNINFSKIASLELKDMININIFAFTIIILNQ